MYICSTGDPGYCEGGARGQVLQDASDGVGQEAADIKWNVRNSD